MPSTLYETPKSSTFTPDLAGRAQLGVALDGMFRSTRAQPPGSVRDVRLDPRTLSTQSGYRYISSALFRMCRMLAPGLSSTVVSVGGVERPADRHDRTQFSAATACAIFNQVVDLRFETVAQAQLVLDEEHRTVEGVLGPKTHYFENGAFVDLVESVLADSTDVVFAGASLVGRRLFLRYLSPQIIPTVVGPYKRGYAFCMTEAGDDAVRGYLLYQSANNGSCCLEAPTSGLLRQRRTGARFIENIKRLLGRLLRDDPRDISADLEGLMQSYLFRGNAGENVDRIVAGWRRRFKLAGMPADIASVITGRLLGYDKAMGAPLTAADLARFTEYDMFVLAMDEGRKRGQRLRELTERATFTVFLGDTV